jgi:hypothetical protein
MVARVSVLVHWREGVGSQRGARTAEARWVHRGMMMARWTSSRLGACLVEVMGGGVVMLAVCRRSYRRPADGVVRHPRVLLQFDES